MTAIALKLHQSIQLTQSERRYWNNLLKEEKAYIIIGDSQQTLDFTQYQDAYFSGDYWRYLEPELPNQNPPTYPIDNEDSDPDLFADEPPSTSSSEESNPDLRRNTSDPGFNPFSEDSQSQQKAQGHLHQSISTLLN